MGLLGLRRSGSSAAHSVCVITVTTWRRTRARERVLEGLLDHVAHPAGGTGDENPEGQRLELVAGQLVPRELVADLRPVAVDQRDVPAGARQLDDRGQALTRVPELVGDRGTLPRRRDRVAPERHDDRFRPPLPGHGGRT